ncbi:MAG: BREX system serine/threonine kinase PglW, partial [Thermoanaerobaculia bacterium]
MKKTAFPWIEALVFLSDPAVECRLAGPAGARICLRDRKEDDPAGLRQGILAALIERRAPGVDPTPRFTIDAPVARTVSKALDQAGIRPSQKARRVGDYELGELLADGPRYQDRAASHVSLKKVHCRVRQYLFERAATEEDRRRLDRAARREFLALQG